MFGRPRATAPGWRITRAGVIPLLAWLGSASAPSPAQDAPSAPVMDPIAAEVEMQRGILDYQAGRYAEALGRFERVGQAAPDAADFRRLAQRAMADPSPHRTPAGTNRGHSKVRGDATDPPPQPSHARGEGVIPAPSPLAWEGWGGGASVGGATREQPSGTYAPAGAGGDVEPAAADGGDGAGSGPRDDYYSRRNAYPGGPGTIPGPDTAGFGGSRSGPANPNRRYNLALINGYEYDTNVALAPSIALTGLGAGKALADSRYLLGSFGEFRLAQRRDWVLGLIGSTYDTYQFKFSQFNLQDYMGGLYSNVALGRLILGGRYEFHDSLLAGKQFTTDHRLTPNLTLREGSFGHFTTFYEYEGLGVKGFALVPAQRRSGDINAVGATQAVYLVNGNGRLYFNYRYENARTQGSDFDRSTNQVSARLEIPLPMKTVFNTEFRQFFDDYKHPNSLDFQGRARVDRRIEARVGVQTFFTSHLSLRLDYVYTDSHSNVENLFGTSFYTYHRNVLSALLVYDF